MAVGEGFDVRQVMRGQHLVVSMVLHDPAKVECQVAPLTDSGQLEIVFVDTDDRFDNERLPTGALPRIAAWLISQARRDRQSSRLAGVIGAGVFRPGRAQFVEEDPTTAIRLIKEHRRPAHRAAGVRIDVARVGIRQRREATAVSGWCAEGLRGSPRVASTAPAAAAVFGMIPGITHRHLLMLGYAGGSNIRYSKPWAWGKICTKNDQL